MARSDLFEEYLTTKELAELLRVKERKIYELAGDNALPYTRVTGKLLFPRRMIEAWLSRNTELGASLAPMLDPPRVAVGSHDPLLEWSLRNSRCNLAMLFDGSLDGLGRLARREAFLAGMHIHEGEDRSWNVATVKAALPAEPIVVVEWAWRQRGLVVAPGNPHGISSTADLKGRRVVPRQSEAGAQQLLRLLMQRADLAEADVEFVAPVRNEADLALAVLNGRGEVGLGLECVAREHGLEFVPLIHERFDLVVWRRLWFEEPLQMLFDFARTDGFAARAAELGGYDVSGLGTVHYNGP